MNDDFSIRMRVEEVSLPLEECAQGFEIVDFTVEDDPKRFVLVVNWLVAAVNVDDAKPPHSEHDVRCDVISRIVGPPVHHRVAHRENFLRRHRLPAETQQTRDSTHTIPFLLPPSRSRLTDPT